MKRERKAKIVFFLILFVSILSIFFAEFVERANALEHLIRANFLLIMGFGYFMVSELWKLSRSVEDIKKKMEAKTVQE